MEYRDRIRGDIKASLKQTSKPPVLFVGSGLSRRYISLPSWRELLEEILTFINHTVPLDFYLQRTDKTYLDDDLIEVAEDIAELVHEWGWSEEGKQLFPKGYYSPETSHTVFFKFLVSHILKDKQNFTKIYDNEIKILKSLNTETIITTNYDAFLETLFDFPVSVGQELRVSSSGRQIFKVHGSQESPESIIMLPSDYANFSINHKYIFSKLLIYFVENTCLFAGYSISDPHIRELIFDAAEATQCTSLDNVFVLDIGDEGQNSEISTKYKIVKGHKSVEINAIKTNAFEWVYQAFGQQ